MSNKRSKYKSHKKSSNFNQNTQITEVRGDGWSNLLTNLGSKNSRINTTTYAWSPKLDKPTLTKMYANDGITRQVINMIIDDAMRGFINAEQELLDELKRLSCKQKITDAASWARLYGGSALIAFADDGQSMDSPLNLDRLKKVVSLQVYDRYQLSSMPDDISKDFYSEHYGQTEVYTVMPISGEPFRVHRSRMHLFSGERIPFQDYISNDKWGDSVLQSIYEPLRNYGQSMNALAEITQDFIQTTISINNLTEILSQGNEDQLIKRLEINDLTRSVSNTVMLDAQEEKYSKHASSVSGLADIIEKIQEQISACARRSMTRLFGITSKGLGNSGNDDSDNDNNTTEAYRSDELEPCIDWIVTMLEAQKLWTDKPESFDWTFAPLKVSNEHELAKNRLLAAQTDQIYMDRGVDPLLLFRKRYAEGGFQTDIFISDEDMAEIEADNEMIETSGNNSMKDVTEVKEIMALELETKSNKDSIVEHQNAFKLV
jgi:phage-related protein (TIGR01555 family)